MAQRVTIIRVRNNPNQNVNEELQWLGNSLGLFNQRDRDSSCFRIFITLVKKSRKNEAISSDEIAAKLSLSRGTVVHHLNKLIDSGLVVTSHNKYMLRVRSLERLVKEIHADVDEFLKEVEDAGKDLDKRI